MIFEQTNSPQKNAAPLQSFVKRGNSQVPNAQLSAMNPMTPRDSGPQNILGIMLPKLPTLNILTPVMYLGMNANRGNNG